MNHQIYICFADRKNPLRRITDVKATLTTDHAASSHGLPVVVIDGTAMGPADLDAMHSGCCHWLRCDSIKTTEFYGSGNAKYLAEQAGYAIADW